MAHDRAPKRGNGKQGRDEQTMTIRSLNKLRPGDVDTLGDGSDSDGGGLYLGVRDGGRL